jgi:uncharacterized protein (TIGR00730 family)
MYKNIAVFCGSKSGNNPLFMQQAAELGKLLADNGMALIYGGGKAGLMGSVADAVMNNNGKVIGVIPEVLLSWEQQHKGITELKVVSDMHVRKKTMYELCDAAVILPGGHGTLDEMFELITWNTLKIHEKKIILLNAAGYYDHLIAHAKNMQQQGFLHEDWQLRISICNAVPAIISCLNESKN